MLRSLNFTILQTCNLLSLSSMISKINTQLNKEMSVHPLVIIHFDSFERKVMNNLPRLPRIFIRNWVPACYSCGWFYPAAVSRPGGWIWPSRVPAAGYKLRLTPSYGWLEFRLLDMGCRRFRPTVDLSYGSWIRVTADYILRLTRVSAPGYDLRQIPSCDWLQVAADSILQLTRVRRLDTTCDWPML